MEKQILGRPECILPRRSHSCLSLLPVMGAAGGEHWWKFHSKTFHFSSCVEERKIQISSCPPLVLLGPTAGASLSGCGFLQSLANADFWQMNEWKRSSPGQNGSRAVTAHPAGLPGTSGSITQGWNGDVLLGITREHRPGQAGCGTGRALGMFPSPCWKQQCEFSLPLLPRRYSFFFFFEFN